MSALPPKADMCSATQHVRFVPKADMCSALGDVHLSARSGQSVHAALKFGSGRLALQKGLIPPNSF